MNLLIFDHPGPIRQKGLPCQSATHSRPKDINDVTLIVKDKGAVQASSVKNSIDIAMSILKSVDVNVNDSDDYSVDRLGICQKIYTAQFLSERILHTENA